MMSPEMSPDERALRESLVAYLDGRVARADFHGRLVQASWSNDEAIDPVARDLANEILLALDEQSSGLLDESELRAELRQLVGGAMQV